MSALLGGLFLLPGSLALLDKIVGDSFFSGWGSVALISLVLFKFVPGVLMLFGGYQMLQRRSYTWAVAAGILGVVACSIVSMPIGIWVLVVLAREEVKAAFGLNGGVAPVPGQPDHFWRRFAVVMACVILIPMVVAVLGLLAAIAIPNFVKGRAQAQRLTAQELQQAGIHQDASGEFWKDSSQSFPLDANGRFSIDNVDGRIEIHGWSSNVVALTANIHGKTPESVKAVKFEVESDPDRAAIHTEHSSNFNAFQWSWAVV